jgi:2-polyprenyl-3-methyl-5-hydroxy-6-metoxy-1,4-benzoquinol methylase
VNAAVAIKPGFTCLICKGSNHQPVFHEFGIDILRCQRCRHVFSSYTADPHYQEFWGSEVEPGDHKYWSQERMPMYRDFQRRFIAGRSGRLVDMGCGLGFFLKSMARYSQWESHGCEISPSAAAYARNTLGLKNVINSRLESVDLPLRSFDVITMWDVIDHIPYPDDLLNRCHQLLKNGGLCFIRTPNVDVQLTRARLKQSLFGMKPDSTYLQARDHVHQYSVDSIYRLLERNRFTRIKFIHLAPVQPTGMAKLPVKFAKVAGSMAIRALDTISGGRWNLDNLFVLASKVE